MVLFVAATSVSMEQRQDCQNETKDTILDPFVVHPISSCTLNTLARAPHTHKWAHVHKHPHK